MNTDKIITFLDSSHLSANSLKIQLKEKVLRDRMLICKCRKKQHTIAFAEDQWENSLRTLQRQ